MQVFQFCPFCIASFRLPSYVFSLIYPHLFLKIHEKYRKDYYYNWLRWRCSWSRRCWGPRVVKAKTAKIRLKSDMKITNGKDSRKFLHLIHDAAIPASLQSSLWTWNIGIDPYDVLLSDYYHMTLSWIHVSQALAIELVEYL